jgi:hypothetical protein
MPAGQSVDLGQRIVDGLGIESAPVGEERFLVAEIAGMRAPARDDDGVGDEIELPPDQVAPDAREAFERSDSRAVQGRGAAGAEVGEERGPGVLAGAQENGIGVRRGLVGERCDMEAAQCDIDAALPIVVGDPVRTGRRGDVHLDDDEVGCIVEVDRLDVFVMERDLVVVP